MKIDELMDMKVKDLLETFCILYSPECGYYYGIGRWDDAGEIFEEFDLEEEYCFFADYLIPIDYGFDCGEDVLTKNDLKEIMNRLGIVKKVSCPKCGSKNYHLNYNDLKMLCQDCGHQDEPQYVENNMEEEK